MPLEDGMLEDGNISESASEASEEDLQRVRESSKKAKQVRGQIQQMQQYNQQFADMLSLLLQHVNNEHVLGYIFNQMVDYKVSIPAIFAQFLPYLQDKIDINVYHELYQGLRAKLPTEKTVSSTVTWLRDVRSASTSLSAISLESYTLFVVSYLGWTGVVDTAALDVTQEQELEKGIKSTLSSKS